MGRVRARGAAKAFDRQLDQGLGPAADRVARLDARRLQPGGRLGKPGLEAAAVPDGFQQQMARGQVHQQQDQDLPEEGLVGRRHGLARPGRGGGFAVPLEGGRQRLHPAQLRPQRAGGHADMAIDADQFEKIRQGICPNMAAQPERVQRGKHQRPQPGRPGFGFPPFRFGVAVPERQRP